jgi:hypothetical protein
MTSDAVRALKQAAAGLPGPAGARWEVFEWPGTGGRPNPDWVRRRGHHRASAPVAEQALDEFLAPLEGDPDAGRAAGYRALAAAVRDQLSDAIAVRVGSGKVTLYVVGRTPDGAWAGVRTAAVET